MGSNLILLGSAREAIHGFSVFSFSVVEVGNVHRKTVRHDGYTGVWVCVETSLLPTLSGLCFVHHGCQKRYVGHQFSSFV